MNPGSAEAVKNGCTCPIMDNCRGRGIPAGKGGEIVFYMSENCPLHGLNTVTKEECQDDKHD